MSVVGPFSVKTGQIVYVNDSALHLAPLNGKMPIDSPNHRIPDIELRLYLDFFEPLMVVQPGMHDIVTEAFVRACTAMFGGDPASSDPHIRFGHGEGVRLVRDEWNPYGCKPYTLEFAGDAVVVRRGECTFLDKLVNAAAAGASGVIAISDDDSRVYPSAEPEELDPVSDFVEDVAIVVVDSEDGAVLTAMLDSAEIHGLGQVVMLITPTVISSDPQDSVPILPAVEKFNKARDGGRVLYLNGHPLVNTRLMV